MISLQSKGLSVPMICMIFRDNMQIFMSGGNDPVKKKRFLGGAGEGEVFYLKKLITLLYGVVS